MLSSDVYFHRLLADIDEMDERIRALQTHFAIKKVNVKLDHQAHLERSRDRFGEFKSRIEEMESDGYLIAVKNQQALETARQQLIQAVDMLLEALRTASAARELCRGFNIVLRCHQSLTEMVRPARSANTRLPN